MNITQKMELYDILYDIADGLFREYNPCKIENGKCVRGRDGGCCEGCEYLKENGCSVKALFCKLWLCEPMLNKYPQLRKKLVYLSRIAEKHNLLLLRGSRSDVEKFLIKDEKKIHANI